MNDDSEELPEGKEPVFLALESEFIRCCGDVGKFAPKWRAVSMIFMLRDEKYGARLADFAERLKSHRKRL